MACRARASLARSRLARREIREGRFERTMALITAFAAIVSGWEAYAQHLRGAFSHWLMWTPVALTPPTVVAGAGRAGQTTPGPPSAASPGARLAGGWSAGLRVSCARYRPPAGRLEAGSVQRRHRTTDLCPVIDLHGGRRRSAGRSAASGAPRAKRGGRRRPCGWCSHRSCSLRRQRALAYWSVWPSTSAMGASSERWRSRRRRSLSWLAGRRTSSTCAAASTGAGCGRPSG